MGIQVGNRTHLDWETQLKIAVGAARGIAHVHRQDGGKLVHGNIRSSNIFVNEKKYGIVSDVGLAKLIGPIRLSARQAAGYNAPEVMDTSKVSQSSDVYSFGVVLFELVSGKRSRQITDDGNVILLDEWITSVPRSEWTTKVLDIVFLGHLNEEEAMVQLLQVAMDCVAAVPDRRPRSEDVGGNSGIGPSNGSSLEDQLDDT